MAKQYYEKNKEIILKKLIKTKNRRVKIGSLYKKNKRKTDCVYYLKDKISNSIRFYLRAIGKSKNKKSISKYLPYTMQELKEHLEKQFEPWMNWDNGGNYRLDQWNDNDISTWKWQLDHIIPHSTFQYISIEDQQFRDCWALSNLRPLSAKQNILKGKKVEF
jgi:hypothetical protein